MSLADVHHSLKTDFHWDMAIKEVILDKLIKINLWMSKNIVALLLCQ